MDNRMTLTDGAAYILDRLYECGYRADIVGGAVRDSLLGRDSYDYDITTEATPDEVKSVFEGHRIIDTGIRHGTVTLMLDGVGYEITTWRVDGDYLDNRHPDSVSFTRSLSEDLARRDFTVNAICYNGRDGYTDIYGGIEDLRLGIIRAVGEPERRFREDALRIMRAVRFSAVLGFTLDDATARAAVALRSLLANVSEERIYSELKKMLSADGAYGALSHYPEIILTVIPELDMLKLPREDSFRTADYRSRLLSLFLLNTADPRERFSSAMKRLKTDGAHRVFGERVLELYESADPCTRYGALRLLFEGDIEVARGVVRLGMLMGRFDEGHKRMLEDIIASDTPYKLSALKVSGEDLKALGYSGRAIGETLSRLLDAVMRGECKNGREELLRLCQNGDI